MAIWPQDPALQGENWPSSPQNGPVFTRVNPEEPVISGYRTSCAVSGEQVSDILRRSVSATSSRSPAGHARPSVAVSSWPLSDILRRFHLRVSDISRRWAPNYRTSCAKPAALLSDILRRNYRTSCAESVQESDILRRSDPETIGHLAPFYRTSCAIWGVIRRLTRVEGSPLVLSTSSS